MFHAKYQIYQAKSFWTIHILRKVVLLPLSSMIKIWDDFIPWFAKSSLRKIYEILIATHWVLFPLSLNEIEIISSVITTTCLAKLLLMIITGHSLPLSLCIWVIKNILISLNRDICPFLCLYCNLKISTNLSSSFYAMMILRNRVSNRFIFCYISCLRAQVKAQPFV